MVAGAAALDGALQQVDGQVAAAAVAEASRLSTLGCTPTPDMLAGIQASSRPVTWKGADHRLTTSYMYPGHGACSPPLGPSHLGSAQAPRSHLGFGQGPSSDTPMLGLGPPLLPGRRWTALVLLLPRGRRREAQHQHQHQHQRQQHHRSPLRGRQVRPR